VTRGRRAHLEVDPPKTGCAQRPAREHGTRPRRVPAGRNVGDVVGDRREHLGPYGLLHADPARRPAEHPRRALRRGFHRRRRQLPELPQRHAAAAHANDDGRADPVSHKGGPDVRRGVRAHRRGARHGDDDDRPVHLPDGLRHTGPALRPGRRGQRAPRPRAAGRDASAAQGRPQHRGASRVSRVTRFLSRRSGRNGPDLTDWLTYAYLFVGILVMFGPVAWLVLSSFKTQAGLIEFPPTLLPLSPVEVEVEGYDSPLPLFDVTMSDGSTQRLAQVRRIGLEAQMVDPEAPGEIVRVPVGDRTEVRSLRLQLSNYTEPLQRFNSLTYLNNSVIVTVVAKLITLVINSMAAFAPSKYRFRGRNAVFLVILGTLMIPLRVILGPVYLVITQIGWVNNLWGVIIPGAATPTGVFLLRQYMLTIPDELIDAARMDGASEWRIYWQVVLPLAAPAV